MADGVTDRERRQYALMQQCVDDFRAGRLFIAKVMADLEGLLNALEETPDEWKDRFIEQWSVLEIAYAVSLDRQQPVPAADDHDVAAALAELDVLVQERIGTERT